MVTGQLFVRGVRIHWDSIVEEDNKVSNCTAFNGLSWPTTSTATILMAFQALYLYPPSAGSAVKHIDNQPTGIERLTDVCTISAVNHGHLCQLLVSLTTPQYKYRYKYKYKCIQTPTVLYLWWQKVSRHLVFTQKSTKSHQANCGHKLDASLTSTHYAEYYHIWQ